MLPKVLKKHRDVVLLTMVVFMARLALLFWLQSVPSFGHLLLIILLFTEDIAVASLLGEKSQHYLLAFWSFVLITSYLLSALLHYLRKL